MHKSTHSALSASYLRESKFWATLYLSLVFYITYYKYNYRIYEELSTVRNCKLNLPI